MSTIDDTRLHEYAFVYAHQLTWEHTAHETIGIYERVLGRDIVETS